MHDSKEASPLYKYQVAAFYCFAPLEEKIILSLLKELNDDASEQQVRGTVLLATEGVNGTICGPSKGVVAILEKLKKALLRKTLQMKVSWTNTQAFRRFKARKKSEIVTMGVAGINPVNSAGEYIDPEDWNNLLLDLNTLVIDTRNQYEISIGSFESALNPNLNNFSEFPGWVDKNLSKFIEERRPRRIAMFCTGGIRCEKATSYLLKEGFKDIYHLKGGILRYLEEIPLGNSLWNGECFVFDQRVALNHNLLPGVHRLCHACGMPLTPDERKSLQYVRGVQCPHCEDRYTEEDRARFAERQRQIDERTRKSSGNLSGSDL